MVEITVALIAVFGGVIPYLLQRNWESRLNIAQRKREAYGKFLNDFTERAVAVMHDRHVSGEADDRQRMLARDQLLLYGSDVVIKKYNEWISYADREDADVNEEVRLFGHLLLAIRQDILGSSKITAEDIENLNPFARG